ncbi:MAG: winged helix-turn-helix transcriptional regulator [Candidatus Korarchaeum sp.]|nr:winged helix-turn-helix transcriptional regulator [Candidatus Korarchaeum sp.]MDW8034842.1 winged helix-turn-helix transcriptional regulator [Candidatus Korarchaeum sp.]
MPCGRRSTPKKEEKPVKEIKEEVKLDELSKKILDAMKKLGKPVKCGDIAKEVGVPVQQVTGKMRSLVKSGLVRKGEGGTYNLT